MATTTRKGTVNPAARPRAIALAVATAFLPWYLPQTTYAQAPDPNTLPTGGQITNGAGQIHAPQGTHLQIDQYTQKMIAEFGSFSIGANARVNLSQPGASSIALFRDVGGDPSKIFGNLTANGQLFISNQNGVLFGASARVDVGALFATSLSITDHDFMAGRYHWYNEGNAGSVVNQGQIVTANGYTALVGPQVRNDGIIIARAGSVALAAGDRVSLDMIGDGLISVSVDQSAYHASVINTGSITADGGTVLLTARSANALLDTVINNSGTIRANSLLERNGEIVLDGGNAGVVAVSGTLQAAGVDAGTTGGTIKALGNKVGLFGTASLDASGDAGGGTVLVGGNYQGAGTEQNATAAYVGRDASINADARTTGNGGRAIVWSDETTRVFGSISARGGTESGNGGLIETSGKAYLDVNGARINASAPQGEAGTWLLDPRNVEVVAAITGTQVNGAGGVFDPTSTTNAQVLASDITTALTTGGTNVTIHTGTDGADAGNITVNAVIVPVLTAARTLTFDAANHIQVNQPIAALGNALAVNLFANSANFAAASGTGSVTVGASITTNGGTFQSSGVAFNNTGGLITTGAGTVNINHTGAVTIGANIGATDAAVSVTGSGLTVAAATTVNSGTAALSVNAGVGTLTMNAASLLLTTGTATLTADAMALDATSQVGGTAAATGSAAAAVIQPSTAGTAIGLAGGAGALNLTTAELATIRATNVRIGNATAGALQTGAWIPVTTFAPGSLTLFANGITQTGAINLGTSTSDLLIRGAGDVVLDTDNVFAIVAASKSAGSLSITNVATNPLTVGSVTDDVGTANGITAPGGVSLTASGAGGSLTVNQNISTTNGNVSLAGTGVTVATGVSVSSGSGAILIDGNDGAIQLNDSTLITSNATATAVQIIDGTTAALGNITAASGTVVFGGAAADNLSGAVTQNASTAVNADTVTVNSGGAVTLDSATNTLTNVGAVTRGGALTVVDSADGLTLTGSASTGTTTNAVSITTSDGTLALGANAIVGDSVALTSNGAVGDISSIAGGTITANATTVALTAGRNVTLGAAVNAATTTTIDIGQSAAGTFSTDSGITGTTVTISGGANGDSFDFSGAPSITATLIGNGGSDTVKGRNVDSAWSVNGGTYTDGVGTLSFSGISTLEGGSGIDIFTVSAAASATLNGGAGVDVFNLNAALTGTIDGQAAGGTLAGTQVVNATLTAAGATAGFNGTTDATALVGTFSNITTINANGGGTLAGLNTVSSWDVDANTYTDTVSTRTLSHSGFATLQGGSAIDTFSVSAAVSKNLLGGDGVDVFNLDAALTGTIDGQIDGATLDGAQVVNATLTAAGGTAGFNGTTDATALVGTFSNITTINANGGGTLTGLNTVSSWDVDANTYTDTVSTRTLSHSGFATLQGGSAIDTFSVSAAVSKNLLGGDGVDVFNLDAALTGTIDGQIDGATLDGAQVVNATLMAAGGTAGFNGTTDAAALVGTFSNITTINANGGGTITGLNTVSSWDVDAGSYTDTVSTRTLSQSGFATLQGGSAIDTFTLSANAAANLAGGDGVDVFDMGGFTLTGSVAGQAAGGTLSGVVNATLTATGATTGFNGSSTEVSLGFSDINTINGTGTLQGLSTASTWVLDGTPTYSDGTRTLDIEGFATLQGGTAADTFNVTLASTFNLLGGAGAEVFTINAALTGSVSGEGGSDTLQGTQIGSTTLTASTAADGFSGTTTGVAGFSGIDVLNGSGTLTGRDVASTWSVDGATYTDGAATLTHSGFGTLQGGTAIDTFNLAAAAMANLLGGDGADVFNINAALTGSVNGQVGNDTLNGSTTYVVNAANAGTASNVSSGFSNIENLVGTAGADSFTLSGGTLAGTVDGLAGTDTLTGGNVPNAWTITGPNTGTLTGTGGWSNIENLVGGTGNDSFNGIGGSVGGTISDGGGGTTTLSGTIISGGNQTYTGAVSAGTVILNAGTASISATNAANNFTGQLSVMGSSASITDMSALTIGASLTGGLITNSGALTYVAGMSVGSLTSTASGAVNQSGAITVTGATNINAGGNAITLTSANDFQSTLSLVGGTTQVRDANALTLGNVNVGAFTAITTGALNLGTLNAGSLTATTNGGNITQSGPANVTGGTSLQAGTGSITLALANDFGGVVAASGIGITLNDVNTLAPGTINAGSGSVNLSANSLGAGGTVSAGSASSFSSNANVNGLDINMPNVPLALSGAATQWNFTSTPTSIPQPNPVTVPGGNVGVTYNLASIIASVAQQQAASASSSVAATVAAVIVDEANKTFGTDSVAEDVEYGFAGEVGATPPMDHRIDESGISLPRCVEESREGMPCK